MENQEVIDKLLNYLINRKETVLRRWIVKELIPFTNIPIVSETLRFIAINDNDLEVQLYTRELLNHKL